MNSTMRRIYDIEAELADSSTTADRRRSLVQEWRQLMKAAAHDSNWTSA